MNNFHFTFEYYKEPQIFLRNDPTIVKSYLEIPSEIYLFDYNIGAIGQPMNDIYDIDLHLDNIPDNTLSKNLPRIFEEESEVEQTGASLGINSSSKPYYIETPFAFNKEYEKLIEKYLGNG